MPTAIATRTAARICSRSSNSSCARFSSACRAASARARFCRDSRFSRAPRHDASRRSYSIDRSEASANTARIVAPFPPACPTGLFTTRPRHLTSVSRGRRLNLPEGPVVPHSPVIGRVTRPDLRRIGGESPLILIRAIRRHCSFPCDSALWRASVDSATDHLGSRASARCLLEATARRDREEGVSRLRRNLLAWPTGYASCCPAASMTPGARCRTARRCANSATSS